MDALERFVDTALDALTGVAWTPARREDARSRATARLGAADVIVRDWAVAERLDTKLSVKICRLSRAAAQAIARSRLLCVAGSEDFVRSGRAADELLSAVDSVESAATPASLQALAELAMRSLDACAERLNASGTEAAGVRHDLVSIGEEIERLAKAIRYTSNVALAAACGRAAKLLAAELPPGLDDDADFFVDLLVGLQLASALAQGRIDATHAAHLLCLCVLKRVCDGGIVLYGGVDEGRAGRLRRIVESLDAFGLDCPAPDFEPRVVSEPPRGAFLSDARAAPIVEGAEIANSMTEDDERIALPSLTASDPQAEPSSGISPSVERDALHRPASPSPSQTGPRPIEANFLRVVALSDAVPRGLRELADDYRTARRPWPGLADFLRRLENAGALGFAEVGRAIREVADA